MEALLDRRIVIALAVAGGVFALLSSILAVRGKAGERIPRILSYAGYGFMGASMLLFILAGLRG